MIDLTPEDLTPAERAMYDAALLVDDAEVEELLERADQELARRRAAA